MIQPEGYIAGVAVVDGPSGLEYLPTVHFYELAKFPKLIWTGACRDNPADAADEATAHVSKNYGRPNNQDALEVLVALVQQIRKSGNLLAITGSEPFNDAVRTLGRRTYGGTPE
jgi:hypothetical protein